MGFSGYILYNNLYKSLNFFYYVDPYVIQNYTEYRIIQYKRVWLYKICKIKSVKTFVSFAVYVNFTYFSLFKTDLAYFNTFCNNVRT